MSWRTFCVAGWSWCLLPLSSPLKKLRIYPRQLFWEAGNGDHWHRYPLSPRDLQSAASEGEMGGHQRPASLALEGEMGGPQLPPPAVEGELGGRLSPTPP